MLKSVTTVSTTQMSTPVCVCFPPVTNSRASRFSRTFSEEMYAAISTVKDYGVNSKYKVPMEVGAKECKGIDSNNKVYPRKVTMMDTHLP